VGGGDLCVCVCDNLKSFACIVHFLMCNKLFSNSGMQCLVVPGFNKSPCPAILWGFIFLFSKTRGVTYYRVD